MSRLLNVVRSTASWVKQLSESGAKHPSLGGLSRRCLSAGRSLSEINGWLLVGVVALIVESSCHYSVVVFLRELSSHVELTELIVG